MTVLIHLLSLTLAAGYRRWRYDLIGELVVLVCAILLGATFYYIFNDFVNEHLGELNPALREKIGSITAYISLGVITAWQSKRIRHFFFSPKSLFQATRRMGERPETLTQYAIIWTLFFLASTSSLLWIIIYHKLMAPRWFYALALQSILYLCVILAVKTQGQIQQREWRPLQVQGKSILRTMICWRLQQMLRRSPLTWLALSAATISIATAGYLTYSRGPEAGIFFALYSGGFLVTLPLFFQLATDLKAAWTERTMGVSHEHIEKTYTILAYLLGFPLILLFLGFRLPLFESSSAYGIPTLQYIGIFITPLYLAPTLMFQIDARRPAIQIITLFFLGLFISTAIFVHIFGLILLPGLSYYTVNNQKGRYYRV